MKKLKLICLGICLFFVGLEIEIIKNLVNSRLNRLVKKSGRVSDKMCVLLTNCLSHSRCVWKSIESEYLGLYRIEKDFVL